MSKKESDAASTQSPRRVGRPRKAESFRRLVAVALSQEPELQTLELLRRATDEGYDGGKSAFYALVASTRVPTHTPHGRDALPGECSRHDLVEVMIPLHSHGPNGTNGTNGTSREVAEGARRKTHLFVSRLEYSRFLSIAVLDCVGIEPVARALIDHYLRAGGVPLLATFDSRKLGAAGSDAPTELVSSLAYLALDLGVGVELPKPSRSRAGASDRLVRIVKDELLSRLRPIADEADLANQIEAFTAEHNARISAETGRSPLSLLEGERRRLRPVRVTLDELTLRVPIVVHAGGIVVHEGRKYMIASEAAGSSGMLFVSAEQIRIVAGSVTGIFTRFRPTTSRRAV